MYKKKSKDEYVLQFIKIYHLLYLNALIKTATYEYEPMHVNYQNIWLSYENVQNKMLPLK